MSCVTLLLYVMNVLTWITRSPITLVGRLHSVPFRNIDIFLWKSLPLFQTKF